jgi:hypothetical protein
VGGRARIMDSPNAGLFGRVLSALAVALYGAALLLPFVHGTIRLLVVPFSRTLTLPQFMQHLSDDQPGFIFALVVLVMFVVPGFLLAVSLLCAWSGSRTLPAPVRTLLAFLRWRGWIAAGLGVTFTAGLRAAASASGGPALRMLPGVWVFCASLIVASAALSLTAPRRARRAACPPA